MQDLQNKLLRCIGDPRERFVEDPVRMLRAVAFAARLDFRVDTPIRDAIKNHHGEIKNASPARLVEELYKLLRSGVSTKTFKAFALATVVLICSCNKIDTAILRAIALR